MRPKSYCMCCAAIEAHKHSLRSVSCLMCQTNWVMRRDSVPKYNPKNKWVSWWYKYIKPSQNNMRQRCLVKVEKIINFKKTSLYFFYQAQSNSASRLESPPFILPSIYNLKRVGIAFNSWHPAKTKNKIFNNKLSFRSLATLLILHKKDFNPSYVHSRFVFYTP